jgi:hypothetical protein
MVIIYFGCFAVLWVGIAATVMTAEGFAVPVNVLHDGRAAAFLAVGVIALAGHAVAVVLLAWKAQRWFFSHGPVAVMFCGLPLIPLVRNVWLVPAFLYLIAVLHVWLASRHESLGRLQATQRHSTATGPV